MLFCTFALCASLAGCFGSRRMNSVYPEPNRKTIDELYFEALAASNRTPENSLGLNPPAGASTLSQGSVTPILATPPIPLVPPPAPLPAPVPQTEVPLVPPAATPAAPDEIPKRDDTIRFPPGDFAPQPVEPPPSLLPEVPEVTQAVSQSSPTQIWKKHPPQIPTAPKIIKRVSHIKPGGEPNYVSENFEETDIRQALQVLATQAGVTLIVDEQVSGTITTLIEEEPFDAALRKVLMPLGLVYRRMEQGEYIVAVPDPSSPLFSRVSERIEFRPMNVGPDELIKLLSPREAKFVTVIDKRNLMLIEAPKEYLDPIVDRLQKSDNPVPQVELEAIICVIAPDRGFKAGLDWNHAVSLNGSEVLRLGMTGLAFNGQGSRQGTNSAFSDFAVTAAFVRLLAQEGYLSIRAAPRVTARDGEPAKIAITRQSFFSTQPFNENAFFRQEIEQVEAGITLEITPIIRGNNITVKIEKAEVSEDIRTTDVNASVANNPYPLINRRTVSTTVNVKDSETIVIGGLVQRQTVDRISRTPVLGSIPYAGRMFQTVEQLEQDAEVVIFISPKIVTSAPALSPFSTEPLMQDASGATPPTDLDSSVPRPR